MSLRLLRSVRWPRALAGIAGCAGAVLAVTSAQCNIYGPSLLLPGDASPEGAALEAGSDGRALIPGQPPPESPDSATGTYTIVDALDSIDLGVGDGGAPDAALPPLGWDLDGVITCPGPPSCIQMAGTTENCDDPEGRDHTGLKLFRALGATAAAGVAAANQGMQIGEFGLIVQVKGYNGLPNDSQLTVSIFASNGVLGTGDGGVTLHHDGNDKWTVDPRYLMGPPPTGFDCSGAGTLCEAVYTTTAYVTNNVLVAPFPSDVPITFGGRANIGGALMTLSQMVLVGTLETASIAGNGLSWRIVDGTISGRWGSANLLGNMATIPDPTSDAGLFLCGDADPAYGYLKNYICGLQDIVAEPQYNSDPNAACDAISMSFGFTAEPAQLGTVSPLPPTPMGCMNGTTPFTDSCLQ
jgi:hypothetical protein